MFQAYFQKINEQLTKKSKDGKVSQKILADAVRTFLADHFPDQFRTETGAALDSFGHRVDGIDILQGFNFHKGILKMFGNAMPIEMIYGAIFVVPRLTPEILNENLQKVLSFKRLSYRVDAEEGTSPRKIAATIFAYDSDLSYHQIKDYTLNFYQSHDILNAYEVDFIVVMNHSLMVKDWHELAKRFKAIETKKDSLMLFYILYHEFVTGDEPAMHGFSYRNYILQIPEYKEY